MVHIFISSHFWLLITSTIVVLVQWIPWTGFFCDKCGNAYPTNAKLKKHPCEENEVLFIILFFIFSFKLTVLSNRRPFEQYFDDPLVKPEGLGMCSDQIIEHMHSYIKCMMLKSRYLCSIADSEESAKHQHNGIIILRLVSFCVRNKK